MPCRASSHQSESERSRQVEGIGEFRAAASTMRDVNAAQDPTAVTGKTFFLGVMNFWRKRWVAAKPRTRKLTVSKGSSTTARRKSPFAGRGSALNRRSRAHIGGLRSDQTVFHKMIQKIVQVGSQRFRIHVKFIDKLEISGINGRRGSY